MWRLLFPLMLRAVARRAGGALRPMALAPQVARAVPRYAVSRMLHASAMVRDAPKMPIGEFEPRLSLTFTCTVPDCGTRSSHEFTKRSYEKGIVLVQCPGCKNRYVD